MRLRFVERKWWYSALSGLLIVPGVVFLALGGLQPGIEFRGGTLLDVGFQTAPPVTEIHDVFATLGHTEAQVQGTAGQRVAVRTTEMQPDELARTRQVLSERYGSNLTDLQSNVVSPSFSGELVQNAVKSIALASVLIVLLIAWAFRSFGWSAFRYGIAAIVALLHDAAVVLGLFAILGYFLKVEVDSLFVTAVLTIIGYRVLPPAT